MKLQELLSQDQKDQLGRVRTAAIKIWHSPQHRHYTDHKPDSHSERIVRKLSAMAEGMSAPLTSNEAFVLLCAAYLHDIGMQKREAGMSLDEVRDKHHELSKQMIEGSIKTPSLFPKLDLEAEFADEVALVSAAHRKLDLSSEQFTSRAKGDELIRLRLLSAMLRLADALDLDYNRVFMENLKLEDVSQTSRLHWWRCHYVEGVFIDNGSIRVNCAVPSKEYEYYIETSIKNEIDREVEKVKDYLWPEIKLSVGKVTVRVSETKEEMTPEDFAVFRALVTQEIESISLQAQTQVSKLHEYEEKAARQAAEEGRRQSGSDPPLAVEHLQRAAQLFLRLGRHRSAAEQYQQIASIYLEQGDLFSAANVNEHIGLHYLSMGSSFQARWAFGKALEQTPLPEPPNKKVPSANGEEKLLADDEIAYVRRILLYAQANSLQGEFNTVDKLLKQAQIYLGDRPSPLFPLYIDTNLLLHILRSDWASAFAWALHLEPTIISQDDAKAKSMFGYQMSLMAALSGQHSKADLWIDWAFKENVEELENAEAFFSLYARRGWIRRQSGAWQDALGDFLTALDYAERLSDTVAIVAQFQNARILLDENGINISDYPQLTRLVPRVTDLLIPVNVERMPRDEEGHMADALSTYLSGLCRAIESNDIAATCHIQKKISKLYEQSGHLDDAMTYAVSAGDRKQLEQVVNALLKSGERTVSTSIETILKHHLSPTPYSVFDAIGGMSKVVAEYLSFDTACGVAKWLVNAACLPEAPSEVQKIALSALRSLVPLMDQSTVDITSKLASDKLDSRPQSDVLMQKAAAQLIVALACAKRTHISDELIGGVIQKLIELAHDRDVQPDALSGLLEIERERKYIDVEQARKIRDAITNFAFEKHWLTAINCYVIGRFGDLPDDIARNVFLRFKEQVVIETKMANTSHYNLSQIQPSFVQLELYAPSLQPGLLSDEEAEALFEGLLALACHENHLLVQREAAFYALCSLSEQLMNLERAGQLKEGFVYRVAAATFEAADQPQLGPLLEEMESQSNDRLSRYQISLGTTISLKSVALSSLGRLYNHVDPAQRSQYLSMFYDKASDPQPLVRLGVVNALRYIYPCLADLERKEAMLQIQVFMHDSDAEVCHAAIFTASEYVDSLQDAQSSLVTKRLIALLTQGNVEVRRQAATFLQRMRMHPSFTLHQHAIEVALEQLKEDPVASIRCKDWIE